ncbi:hypothetical protein H8R02_28460 [Ramlibacter sp. GTP1]|uniref:Uncharacterized protein n=1 Tax=Ramlibacter albus TaxID=2079448 RepID=A0A923S8U3_9BURK|nr:hypothetical protein [Ramlibacter albus]MBC5768427.1 hypothetical protein [Ramlibacter albus]
MKLAVWAVVSSKLHVVAPSATVISCQVVPSVLNCSFCVPVKAGSVPLTVSVVSLVMKSLALTPVSSVMPVMASGWGVSPSMVTACVTTCVPTLPAVSASLAV